MLDLDKLDKIPDYEIHQNGKTITFDTILLVSSLGTEMKDVKEPKAIAETLSKILGIALGTQQALAVIRDFETFSNQYEAKIKALFGVVENTQANKPE